ncbi:MAG: hypothetical protein HOC63_00680 [Rhodospirillales bacterium]|nr:hypothetical protein [Rhodospirillales bacterium]MBT4041094.1 hypothetical protein [Rhodospirillales bacterium]MBT4625177.1 hypothetical protein [Rhodospirillales bacterium]MBT5351448.1 hypothetical protein [Rhodospirillales bacterium]MBT5521963.1 hypothetical protein [Rhodospirillales bacterium]
MAENDQNIGSFELIVPTKSGYKSTGVQKTQHAPEPAPAKPTPEPAPPPAAKPASEPAPPPPPAAVKPAPAPPKSTPAPAKKPKPLSTDAKGQSEVLADSVVSGFIKAMNATAAKPGGHLLPEDIAMLTTKFQDQSEKIATSITRSMNVYANSQNESQFDPERVNAFDRVLVKQFSHLLKDDEFVAKNPDAISRRVLNGIFVAVRMVAGPDRIEQYEQDAYLVMQRVRDDMKDAFSWESVYADMRVKNMLNQLLVSMVPHFMKLETRLDWFLSVINSNLSEVSSTSPVTDWKLSPNSVFFVLEALFTHLRINAEDDMARMRLSKQFGAETLEVVLELLGKMSDYRAKNL